MHPNLIAALVEVRRRSCPYGVVPGQPNQLCGNCSVGMTWRRHLSQRSRSIGRRWISQLARARTWIFAAAAFVLRVVGTRASS
jgi:hypothetical protein